MTRSEHPRRSPVDELLLEAVRLYLGQGEPSRVASRLSGLTGEEDLLRRAHDEGLSGILAGIFADLEVGGRLGKALRQERHRTFAHGARTLDLLEHLGESFARAGLRAMVLKGAALLADLYRGDLGVRPVSDLDLLVRREELPRVKEVLWSHGLRPLGPRWRGDGLEIDLHVDLILAELLGHRRSAYTFASAEVWERSLPCAIGGPAIRVLSPELQVLHLAVHAVKHAFGRWIWLVDLSRALETVELDSLLTAASKVRGDRALTYCSHLLTKQIGVKTPLATARLPELSRLESTWLHLIAERRHRIGLGRVLAGLAIPSSSDRLAYWREVAFPSVRSLRRAAPGRAGVRVRWLIGVLGPRFWQTLRLVGSHVNRAAIRWSK